MSIFKKIRSFTAKMSAEHPFACGLLKVVGYGAVGAVGAVAGYATYKFKAEVDERAMFASCKTAIDRDMWRIERMIGHLECLDDTSAFVIRPVDGDPTRVMQYYLDKTSIEPLDPTMYENHPWRAGIILKNTFNQEAQE